MSLARATSSELTKQFTTSMWWILALILFLYVGVTAGGLAGVLKVLNDAGINVEYMYGFVDRSSDNALVAFTRDRDPARRASEWLAGLSAGWQPDDDSQWDAGVNVGLNRDSPDLQLYAGYVRRF